MTHTKPFPVAVLCTLMPALVACTDANHLGNIVTLPIHAVAAGAENAVYDRRRGKVKAWITANEPAMRAERFNGPVTRALLNTLPENRRAQALRDFRQAAPHADFAERATVVVMVLGS